VPADLQPSSDMVSKLIDHATRILDGDTALPAPLRARTAALLARTALEIAVDDRLTAAGLPMPGAKMRNQLICIRVAVDPTQGPALDAAYAGLSRSCHQHAYELSPTASEVRHLVDIVRAWTPPPTEHP